jgi:DNA-binding GntR family transcriptional regulator
VVLEPASSNLVELHSGGRLSDLAYNRVLEALFERRVPAGAFVSQSDLVRLLGVPVAPLRDALRVLEAEGIVTIHPRSGIQFVKPGLELTRSTYQFRSIIEKAAVRVFAETAEDAAVAELSRRHRALAARIEAEGLASEAIALIEDLEQALHNAVVGALGNPLIEQTYRRMHNYLKVVRLDRRLTPPLALRSLREHLAILDACAKRDPDAAEAALRLHFTAALQRHLGLY